MSASSSTERIKTTGGRRRVKKTIEVPVSPSNGSAASSGTSAAAHAPLMPVGFYGPSGYAGHTHSSGGLNVKSVSPRGSKAFPIRRHSRQKSGDSGDSAKKKKKPNTNSLCSIQNLMMV
jgi:hypothetical protein